MEEIKLSGSPAALIAADDAEDDDEGAPVRFHEAENASADDDDDDPEPEQLSAEQQKRNGAN